MEDSVDSTDSAANPANPASPANPAPTTDGSRFESIVHPNIDFDPAARASPRRVCHRRWRDPIDMTNNQPAQNFISEPGPNVSTNANPLTRPISGQQQQNSGPPGAMNGANAIPTNAGYPMDLNLLYQKVTELGTQLQINREQSSTIVGQVAEVRRRAEVTGTDVTIQQLNGELNGTNSDHETQQQAFKQELEQLRQELRETRLLLSAYENAMTEVTEMVRKFVYAHTMEKINIHKRCHEELTTERQVSMELRQGQEETFGRLRLISGWLRKVNGEQANLDATKEEQIAYWKHETVQLRKIVYGESYRQGLDVMGGEGEDESVGGGDLPGAEKAVEANDDAGKDQDDSREKE